MEYSWSVDTYQLSPQTQLSVHELVAANERRVKPLSASTPAVAFPINWYSCIDQREGDLNRFAAIVVMKKIPGLLKPEIPFILAIVLLTKSRRDFHAAWLR